MVSLMILTVADEKTLCRSKIKLMLIIWPEVRPTGSTEHLEKAIIRSFGKKFFVRGFMMKNGSGKVVN